ncbi:MAG TPA: tetratricopeptide repeat protein, partial [Candidatus Synoicihabitans sp.]|nr:tetratricopeptide repeat protein [Candidatus Synoicihabitans sp.]
MLLVLHGFPLLAQDELPARDDLAAATKDLREGRYEEAVDAARLLRLKSPEQEASWRIEAEALLALGRYRDAVATAGEGLAATNGSLRLRLLLREASLHAGLSDVPTFTVRDVMHAINLTAAVHGRDYARSAEYQAAIGDASLLAGLEPRVVLANFYKPAQAPPNPSRDAFLGAGRLALDKRDHALAARTFRAGLEHWPEDPDLWWGLAASFATGDRTQLVEHAQRALAINPRHEPTLVLLAEHLIDAERRDAAAAHLDLALAVNPQAPEAHALRAVLAHLARDPMAAAQHRDAALATWTRNPRVDHLIGRKLSENYQFSDGAAAQRRALAADPGFTPARVQLAQDLLRLGREDEGWGLAAQAHADDAYNIEAYNLTTLNDRLAGFTVVTSPHFRVRMSSEEAAIYGARAVALLERAHEQLTQRYGLVLPTPTTVEIYPDPKDFAVRTFGMPDIGGFLGVCFGPVFTVNSPASAHANWESVLWHEFAHVVTLTATRNRMPRWLSEGISVYEEQQADARWGQRLSLAYHERIMQGRMQPINRMSAAFLEAKDNRDTQFAYFQSGLVVQFLVERHGFERLRSLLQSLADGREANAALAHHYGELEALNEAFVAYARQTAAALAPGFDLRNPDRSIAAVLAETLPQLGARPNLHLRLRDAREAMRQEDWPAARQTLETLTTSGLYLTGDDNVHAMLATVCAK